jgi:hypothetical protein
MDATAKLREVLRQAHHDNHDSEHVFGKVVDFDAATDNLLTLNLTKENTELTADIISNVAKFGSWVNDKLKQHKCSYGIGGYMEYRSIYIGIPLFETTDEPRLLHLGIDIWGDSSTPVYAPMDGIIHSFADNNHHGDYGPTLILQHDLNGLTFYSLYGHLSRKNLEGLSIGIPIKRGQLIANLGTADENGHWPPHLHFQLMLNMEGNMGDYPGACRLSEKDRYLENIIDPALVLGF